MKRQNWQWGLTRARKDGLVIIEPKANQLQLDLDGARSLRRYGMQYSILRRAGLTRGWREKIVPSKRSNHVHITITMPQSIGDMERVALQSILGSDLKREAFDYTRVKKGNKYPIVFFEREKKLYVRRSV